MRKLSISVLLVCLTLWARPLLAGQFASLGGKFRIAYPDNWKQLDYRYVDSALFNGNSYPYEAVFAPDTPSAVDKEDYLIVTLDASLKFDQQLIDSTLNGWKKTLGAEVKRYGPTDDFSTLWRPVEISFWPKSSIASIYTEPKVTEGDHTRNQLVVKFYERGSANFYFYGPDSTWASFQPIIQSIVSSFSTENIESALPREQVKVVAVDELKARSDGSSSGSAHTTLFVGTGSAIIIIIIAVAALRRRKKRSSASNS